MLRETDVLVIGSGIAGISFALQAAEKYKVAVVTKSEAFLSNTIYAQGGIACAWSHSDHPEKHIHDTLVAGACLCNKKAVEILAYDAPAALQKLVEYNVPFTKDIENEIHLGREGGHSQNRIMHVHDFTGKAVQEVLLQRAFAHPNISLYTNCFAVDLLVEAHICYGAKILDVKNGTVNYFMANYTALCTGGAGQVYAQTTNPAIATGDGIAMAYRAGARIKDMEFVQFHPTALYHPNADGFLISEALRGAGAKLTDENGIPFMHKYHEMADLAPRDIVARAIVNEMALNFADCVYLDVSSVALDVLKNEFPQIFAKCHELGINIPEKKIPVIPSAHYMCGGVQTNLNAQTNISRLYAFGEAACTGVHGANRLASNSLLEGLVFAGRAYMHIHKNYCKHGVKGSFSYKINSSVSTSANKTAEEIKMAVKAVMCENLGIIRNRKKMLRSYKQLNKLLLSATALKLRFPHNFKVLEVENLVQTAIIIAKAALNRKSSVGAHFLDTQSISLTTKAHIYSLQKML